MLTSDRPGVDPGTSLDENFIYCSKKRLVV